MILIFLLQRIRHIYSIFNAFTSHERVVEILGRGETKSSVRSKEGRQVDLRIVEPESFGAALMYFTGSKEHNVAMRSRARERGLSLNEYGLFKRKNEGETNWEAKISSICVLNSSPTISELELPRTSQSRRTGHYNLPKVRENLGDCWVVGKGKAHR